MDEIDKLRAELEQARQEAALAKALGHACYLAAFPPKSAPIVVPTPREGRSAREACGGRDPTARWRDVPVVAIDTETSGVDTATDRVLEVAFVHSDGREWATLVRPDTPIPPRATAVHGIGDADVAGAPTFAEAWAEARARGLLDAHPLAYQASFDAAMVAAELTRAGLTAEAQAIVDVEWLDVFVAEKDINKYARGKKLIDACARRGIEIVDAHRALADARAALAVWRTVEGWCDTAPGAGRLAELLRYTRDRRATQEAEFAEWQAKQARGGRAA